MSEHVAVVSDLHVGSTLGLLHGDGAELDDGGRYSPNQAQRWLWERWQEYLGAVRDGMKRRERLIGIVNGDALDRISKSSQLWSYNDVDVVKAAAKVLGPFREMCRGGFFVLRGTEAHVGPAGALEEGLALALDATRWPAGSCSTSLFHLRLEVGGVRLDVAHHGRAGRLPWTTMNGIGTGAAELALDYAEAGEPAPQIAVRSHTHRYLDSGNNYPIRMVGTPAWQLQTAYGHRIAPGRLPDIGGVVIDVCRGEAAVRALRFRPERDAIWRPD